MTQSLVRNGYEQCLDPLQKILLKIQWASNEDSMVEAVTQYIGTTYKYSLVWIGRYCPQTQTLSGPYTLEGKNFDLKKPCSILAGDLFDQSLLTRQASSITNLKEESRMGMWQNIALKSGIQGAVVQPIHYRKEPVGILLLGTNQWGINPRKEETLEISILANTIGATLQAFHAEEQAQNGSQEKSQHGLSLMMERFMAADSWDQQLELVGTHLHQQNEQTNCGIYQVDGETGEFVCQTVHKLQDKQKFRSRSQGHTLSIPPQSPFFRYLETHGTLAISDVQSTVDVTAPSNLIQHHKVRSLLFSPILANQRLQGFVYLGHMEPHVWTDTQKENCKIAAQILSLCCSPDQASLGIASLKDTSNTPHFDLPSPVSPSNEWDKSLQHLLLTAGKHFQAKWVILLRKNEETHQFQIVLHQSSARRSTLEASEIFPALSEVDDGMLGRSEEAIALSNIAEDLRLLAWREIFLRHKMATVLIARAAPRKSLEHILIFGDDRIRDWSSSQCMQAHQLGQDFFEIQEQRQSHLSALKEQHLREVSQQGVLQLQLARSTSSFIKGATQILSQLLEFPMTGVLLWPSQRSYAKVKAVELLSETDYQLALETKVDRQDPLIQATMLRAKIDSNVDSLFALKSEQLAPETRVWLHCNQPSQLYALPLKPQPKATMIGLILLAGPLERTLMPIEQSCLQDFAQQVAWMLRTTQITDIWRQKFAQLEPLHWYQWKQIEASVQGVKAQCQSIEDAFYANQPTQGTQQLETMLDEIRGIEQDCVNSAWSLDLKMEAIPLAGILRRVLTNLKSITEARQIWTQVHHITQSNLSIYSSKRHLEVVLDEVIKAACLRSEAGGRVDIWCRATQPQWLDLSITDNGQIAPKLMQAFAREARGDRPTQSPLDNGVGRDLRVCQSILQRLGGKLELAKLEDGRSLSRLVLPLQES